VWVTLHSAFDWRRRILKKSHLAEVRSLITTDLLWHPQVKLTSAGVTIAASRTDAAFGSEAHVSISLADGRCDLELLCQLAASSFPALSPLAAYASGGKVLHFVIPIAALPTAEELTVASRGRALYGTVVRQMQRGEAADSIPPDTVAAPLSRPRHWCFTPAETRIG